MDTKYISPRKAMAMGEKPQKLACGGPARKTHMPKDKFAFQKYGGGVRKLNKGG
jgi:hypothetical protein